MGERTEAIGTGAPSSLTTSALHQREREKKRGRVGGWEEEERSEEEGVNEEGREGEREGGRKNNKSRQDNSRVASGRDKVCRQWLTCSQISLLLHHPPTPPQQWLSSTYGSQSHERRAPQWVWFQRDGTLQELRTCHCPHPSSPVYTQPGNGRMENGSMNVSEMKLGM